MTDVWRDWLKLAGLIALVALVIVAVLWAYDGDVKCLVAECRRVKL